MQSVFFYLRPRIFGTPIAHRFLATRRWSQLRVTFEPRAIGALTPRHF